MSKQLRVIVQTESMKRMYQRINNAVGKARMTGVTMVLSKDTEGQWVERNTQHLPPSIDR